MCGWKQLPRAEDGRAGLLLCAIQRIEVKTENGSIYSKTWDDDTIHFTLEKWATGRDRRDAEDIIEDIEVHIDRRIARGVLSIDVEFPRHNARSHGCDVSISLPSHLYLKMDSSNGAITVFESRNGLECSTSNGTITIQDTEGNADLKTSNGIITVVNHYGELYGKTSNGLINADIVLPEYGKCILKTSNGALTLSIPATTSAMIDASTSNGKIEIEDLRVSIIEMEKTEFRGKMGRGEGSIELETSNGSILVENKSGYVKRSAH